MILGSVQPAYLAWIPFFARMAVSDIFVYLDDVEYSKNSFHNRNRIRNKNSELLLTVPVLYKGNSKALISEIPIDYKQNWQSKHFKSIEMAYSKAPYYNDFKLYLEEYYATQWSSLAELNISFIDWIGKYIGIRANCYKSSELNCNQNGNAKLTALCKKLNADRFIVKPNTYDYHPKGYFQSENIEFSYFRFNSISYPQSAEPFITNLSVLDLVMNCGKNSLQLIQKMSQISNVAPL